MRDPIHIDDFSLIDKHYHNILAFDPTEVYNRLGDLVNPFLRRNRIGIEQTFPDHRNGLCGCGCGKMLEGRRRRWATKECSVVPVLATSIINGDTSCIKPIISALYSNKCFVCNSTDADFKRTVELPLFKRNMNEEEWKDYRRQYNKSLHDMASKIHLDHIIPVHKGGGGCWLSNYQLLCETCHREKTKQERS